MKSNKLVKTITLLGFFILITSFVAYKANLFDDLIDKQTTLPASKNYTITTVQTLPLDSPIINKIDSNKFNQTMMSSSKSGIIIDEKFKIQYVDTHKIKTVPKKNKAKK